MTEPPANVAWLSEYDALTRHAAMIDLGHRTQIELTGDDRATFLNNLCTNEVRKLAPGSGCEAFLTSVQGKTLSHVFIFVTPESVIVDTTPGQAETILAHLDHYLVSEQVALQDRSRDWTALLVSGPRSEAVLGMVTNAHVEPARLSHAPAVIAARKAWLRRVDLAGPIGFLVNCRQEDAAAIGAALSGAGAVPCSEPAFEAARIEYGFPLFGADISDRNLPQEVARDSLAISFVKGCYLGQETIARIDALGHVNKMLVGLRFSGPSIPEPGLELTAAGQAVGQVTSATYSPKLAAPLALGYVRRGNNTPGTKLESARGDAEVVTLPVA